jgi:hypothetical protein
LRLADHACSRPIDAAGHHEDTRTIGNAITFIDMATKGAWEARRGQRRPASNARTHVIDLRAATMSTVELLVVLSFLLVAVGF